MRAILTIAIDTGDAEEPDLRRILGPDGVFTHTIEDLLHDVMALPATERDIDYVSHEIDEGDK